MAKNRNLKGITVEINGSTTGLQDALKDVNSKITQTQAFLRDVENLLKLDPSNIELLAQKQAYLSTQIENTKTKIDALKAAQEQAKAAMEAGTLGADKYEALCREVAATEIQLKKLEEASGGNQAWENSLKGLNTELGKTQEGLTKVDALLKVDPGNLDLASQKATLLANGIDTNNEKLQLLRDRLGEVEGELAKAEGDAEKTKALTEEYDRLTTEVIATEAAIKGMQEEAAKSGQLETKIAGLNSKLGESKEKLTAIDNALKLDPTNVDLLRQKQEALSDQVGLTKEKLEALKQASEQAQSQMESSDLGKDKYDALQREIVETEEELKNLITSSAEANTALVSLGEAGKSLSALGDSIAGVGSKITTAVTVPLAAIGTAAVKTTADFDEQMSKVSAISGATGEELDALREKAKEMGATTKFSASEAGEAFEYMAMAGWDSQEMIEGIGGIMSLAAASGESLATTSDIVTDALTAFGLSASDAGEFADILATASANANTNVALLGESFKYCAPVAGALGYSVEDVTAALGLMANAGIKGSAAGTALRTLMTNLASPTKSSSAALEELGVSLTDAEGNMLPLREVLVQLREGFQETGEISEEAAALISESSEEAAEEAGESIEELAEAREEALETEYETVKKSLDREYDALKDNLDKEYEAQKDSLDARTDELQDALDAQYDAQKKAYEKEYSELKKSLDNAYDAEKDRLDAEYDAAKEGYDAQYDALKDKLDKEYAARKKAYDEAYDELENALDAEYEAQKKAYDKAYDAVKDELDARYDAQQKAYDDEYDARKEALDASYESQKDAYDKEYDALKSAQEKELDALEDSQSEQLDALEKAYDQKIDLINKEYRERLKLVDEEKYNRLKAIEEEIDAINAEADAEERAQKKQEQQEKLSALRKAVERARTDKDRKKAQKALAEYEAELSEEAKKEERKARIDALKEQKETVKEEADQKKEALEQEKDDALEAAAEQKDAETKALKEAQEAELEALKTRQAAELEAVKEYQESQLGLLKKANEEELDVLKERQEAQLAQQKEADEARLEALKESQSASLGALKESQQAQLDARKEADAEALSELKSSQSGQLSELKSSQEASLKELKSTHDSQLSDLKDAHSEQLSALKESNAEKISALKEAHTEQVQEAKDKASEELSELKKSQSEQLETLKDSHSEQLKELKKANKESLEEYKANLEEEQAALESGAQNQRQAALAKALSGKTGMSGLLAVMNASDEEFDALLESIDGANFSVEDFAARMSEVGYPLDEMKAKMETLGISGEEFDRALLLSQGNAETFSQALYDVAEKGTTYEEVMNGLGVPLGTLQDVMVGTAGSAEHMSDVMQDNLNGQITVLKSSIEGLIIKIGESLMPVMEKLTDAIQGVVDTLNGMDEDTYNASDFVKIFYLNGGSYRMVGGWSGSDLSSVKVFVPTNDCYVYWHTSSTNNYAYGFKITAKRAYGDPDTGVGTVTTTFADRADINAMNNRVPWWGAGEKTGYTLESDHYPYPDNLDEFYHWTISSATVTKAYRWIEIEDESVRKALGEAALAQDTADGKRRNFLSQPTPPYDVGDIWMDGKEIKACITARATGASFNASDWVTKNEYTNATYVNNEISKLDTKWSDEDTVFAKLFTNGKRGFIYDPDYKKMYISMDLMKGGTIKLGGTTNDYGNGKFGIYDAYGHLILWMDKDGFEMYNTDGTKIFGVNPGSNASTELGLYNSSGKNIIWMDGYGILVKDSEGHEVMKINPSEGFKVGTANGWGDEVVQIKDAEIKGYIGSAVKSGIDLVAQTERNDGTSGHCLALWNNNYRIVMNSDILSFETYTKFSVWNETKQNWVTEPRVYMQCSAGSGIVAYVATSGFSDRRAKENIESASGFMEKLRLLRVVSFDWKDGHYTGHVSAGLIAQEVQEVLPELVLEDSRGMLGISFEGLVPFLVDAVQTQDREIRELKERTVALEKEVAGMKEHQSELEQRMKSLEARLEALGA